MVQVCMFTALHALIFDTVCLLQRRHEWKKHGTCCTNLPFLNSEHKYFEVSLWLNVKYDIFR